MTPILRRLFPITIAFCWVALIGAHVCRAQDAQEQDDSRKVVNRVSPIYPATARSIGLRGSVRVEVVVSPNGSVKTLEVKGGHPMLAQAAADAVRKWKWVPATKETREPVIVKFDP